MSKLNLSPLILPPAEISVKCFEIFLATVALQTIICMVDRLVPRILYESQRSGCFIKWKMTTMMKVGKQSS